MFYLSFLLRLFGLFSFFILACWQPLAAQHYNFRNYISDQVPNGTVYHILQDSKGFIWFATESGVIRFDGREYEQFTMDDGLTENEILQIYEDSQKRIWFLALSGSLSYFYNNSFYNHSNDPVLKEVGANSTFASFFEDSHQNVWFAGLHNKYLKISRDKKVSKYTFNNVCQGRQSYLYEDHNQQLLLACRDGFFEIGNNKPVLRNLPYHPSHSRAILSLGKGKVLFLAQQGLVYQQGAQQELLIPASKIPKSQSLGSLYLDQNQDLWMASFGDGLFHFADIFHNKGHYVQYLAGSVITGVIQDSEKNLWFSTIGEGVYMLPAHYLKGQTYTKKQGLAANKIRALTVDHLGQIWLGYNGGLLDVITPQGIRHYETHWTKTKLQNNKVRKLQADARGNIWIGTDIGLSELLKTGPEAYQLRHYFRPDSSGYSVKSFSLSKNSQEVYLTQTSGIEKINLQKKGSLYTERVALVPKVRTYTHFFDHAGSLWFSNVNGLNRVGQHNILNYGSRHPLLASRITDIGETPDHLLVLATYGNGVLLFQNGRLLRQITKADGLPENTCKKLFIHRNTLWVATNKGLAKVTLATKNYFSRIDRYTVADGLISNEVNDLFVDDKNVYIATSKGLDIIPNQPLHRKSTPPLIQFTGILAHDQALELDKPARLQPRQNRLLFKFTAITFQDPANVEYQYRLCPDSQWVETSNNSVELSAIQPGQHVFEIRAKKLNSAWSAPAAFQFRIPPPFWQTWWFMGTLILLLLLLIGGGVKIYITVKLRQRMRLLETEYRLQQERERIARDLHDNVGSHLAYIINSLEEIPGQESQTVTRHHRDLRDYTKQTITQLRETIWAIRQETISIGELSAKIKQLIWRITQLRPDFTYELITDGPTKQQLTPVQALNLFRIAQEAINNVLRHSGSLSVKLTFRVLLSDELEMLIQDQGRGFDTSSGLPENHYGLLNMQERARELGAFFQIKSAPGQGTSIYLKVKLK